MSIISSIIPDLDFTACGSSPIDAICLRNSDFKSGTKIIDKPGNYKLCEDIVFHPNGPQMGSAPAENAFDPDFNVYDANSYGLGFFSAIAISASNVNLYLNCHSIEQSSGHALFQRFFAVIELANSPFIRDAGPANFVGEETGFKAAKNVIIQGPGTIGRSSHHGIHGNNNKNVRIKNVTFKDFEVAAVALNNVDKAVIRNCSVPRNRQDVPILGSFSAARMLRPYAKILMKKKYGMAINGKKVTAAELYKRLITSINKVYDDVVTRKKKTGGFIDKTASPDEHYLFNNPKRVVDGPCYAFLIHGHGPAVGGYGFELDTNEPMTSSDVKIENNNVSNVKCWTNEIPSAVVNGLVQNDVRGAILQFISSFDGKPLAINKDGTYRGNVVADLQIMVAKAINEGVLVVNEADLQSVSTIDNEIIKWASTAGAKFSPAYRCNGDSMHHVSKGMAIVRIEDTQGFKIKGNSFERIRNLSFKPFDIRKCTDFHTGVSVENRKEIEGGNVRVISIAAVAPYKNGKVNILRKNKIRRVGSKKGNIVVGIDIQGRSFGIHIDKNKVNLDKKVNKDTWDNLVAMRVREFVDPESVTVGKNNQFQEKVQILNGGGLSLEDEEENAMLLEAHKNLKQNEWQTGGCPFA